jgi:hypothetical protein
MVVQEQFNDLVIATYGRGFWILDDLAPIQQMTPAVREANAYLFTPRPTYRFRPGTVPVTMSDDPSSGQNPPYGAAITYNLKSAPSGDVKIRIEDAKGQTIRTLTGTKNVGLNRITWNLEGEQTREVRMRTSPEYAPEIRLGPEGWRPAFGAPRVSILYPPGNYTVKLSADSQELSAPLVIKKDPNSAGTEADIAAQLEMLNYLRKDLDSAAEMVNQLELIRGQLSQLGNVLGTDGDASVKSAADALDKKLIAVEDDLIQRRLTGQGQDTVRWPPKLLSKLAYLGSGVSQSDFPPTTQQKEVHAMLKQQLASIKQQFDAVVNQDLAAFNKLLRDKNISNVISRNASR